MNYIKNLKLYFDENLKKFEEFKTIIILLVFFYCSTKNVSLNVFSSGWPQNLESWKKTGVLNFLKTITKQAGKTWNF